MSNWENMWSTSSKEDEAGMLSCTSFFPPGSPSAIFTYIDRERDNKWTRKKWSHGETIYRVLKTIMDTWNWFVIISKLKHQLKLAHIYTHIYMYISITLLSAFSRRLFTSTIAFADKPSCCNVMERSISRLRSVVLLLLCRRWSLYEYIRNKVFLLVQRKKLSNINKKKAEFHGEMIRQCAFLNIYFLTDKV
jgi:hypothetical protein